MILSYGDVTSLRGKDWRALELVSEITLERTLRRLARALPVIFQDHPCEIMVPVITQDLEVFTLLSGPFLYIRSDDLAAMGQLRVSVTAIIGLLTTGNSLRMRDALVIEDAYVQSLITRCLAAHQARADAIHVGGFVRVLTSAMRDLCGTVQSITGDRAEVEVLLRSKRVFINAPLTTLLALDDVPADRRVAFYSPVIAELDSGELLAPYLLPPTVTEYIPPAPMPDPRNRTTTRFVRQLVKEGVFSPRVQCQRVMIEYKEGRLRVPANLQIVYDIIKVAARENFGAKDWWQFKQMYPREHFSLQEMEQWAIDAGVLLHFQTVEKKRDGRSTRWPKKEIPLGPKRKRGRPRGSFKTLRPTAPPPESL